METMGPRAERRRAQFVVALCGLIGAAAIVGAFALASTSRGDDGAPERSAVSFRGFPVYWVGTEFGGVPVDRVILPDDENSLMDQVFVTYGACGTAFESGCEPPFLLRITRKCLHRTDGANRVRGRTMFQADHLSVQAGDVVVEIFANPEMQRRIANDMVLANAMQYPNLQAPVPGEELPGSLCELSRFNPRKPTATPADTVEEPTAESPHAREQRELAERVFDSFGDSSQFDDFDAAETYLGWRLVRTTDPRYTPHYICCDAGFTREYKAQPLFEQRYAVVGRRYGIDLYQEPESNADFDVSPYGTEITVGGWTGILWEYRAQRGFEFYSSLTPTGERVRVSVVGERDVISEADIRRFAETLHFGDESP